MNPRYPVYIVSKGRWKSRLTSKALERMGVPYKIVVEEQERAQYESVISADKIITLPKKYLEEYDTCDELGDSVSRGSGAARNFCWQHSLDAGFARHWLMDDNIEQFNRMNNNLQFRVTSGTIFRCMEDFVERYENIAIAGLEYDFFCKSRCYWPAFRLNTRIYSCMLINNSIPYRWRARYNEDLDLSLRALKDGWCTVLFIAFVQQKTQTQRLKGGNTETYKSEGTRVKSEMIVRLHPDCARVMHRFKRWHHHVDYRRFKHNKLKRKSGIIIPKGVNDYGMKLVSIGDT